MPVNFQTFGEQTVLISWPNEINRQTSLDINQFNLEIQKQFPNIILETVTAYCSLTVYLTLHSDIKSSIIKLKDLYKTEKKRPRLKPTTWEIPVCYDLSFALDLGILAKQKKLSIEEIIDYHCKPLYTVDFLGFLPGFPYLSGLDPLLHTPRRASPRLSVAKGSVAIGGEQTGIYPVQCPGGWHIIGRTPLSFFDPTNNQPCFIKPLDSIKFYPISLIEFDEFCESNHD